MICFGDWTCFWLIPYSVVCLGLEVGGADIHVHSLRSEAICAWRWIDRHIYDVFMYRKLNLRTLLLMQMINLSSTTYYPSNSA